MRKRTFFLILLAVLIWACSWCVAEEAAPLRFRISGTETVNVWEDGAGTAHVFLPSFASAEDTAALLADGVEASIGGVPLTSDMRCDAFEPGREYDLLCSGYASQKIVFHASASVASLFVTTGADELLRVHADKDYEAEAAAMLYDADGAPVYARASGCRFGGRGNSTWLKDKKPYDLKLEQAESLLGMGKAKKWSLLANAFDETNLRNKLILDFAGEIAPYRGFAPQCAFVELYLNGDYQGLYLMCQSVKDTVTAFLDTADKDAYEIELMMPNKLDEGTAAVSLNPAMSAEIKAPSDCTEEQRARIGELMAAVCAWAGSDAPEAPGIRPDVGSWAAKMLIEIVFENYDSPNASQYFWGSLREGTVFAGPCWDYDLSMGLYYIDWSTPHAIMAFKDWNKGEDISWYHGAWGKEAIRERVLALYGDTCHDRLLELVEERIPEEAALIAAAARSDRLRWPEYRRKCDSFESAVAELTDFMRERLRFLDSMWIDGEEYHVVTMRLPNTRMLHLYVPHGESCEELPEPSQVSLAGEGMEGVETWYREGSDEPFDPDTKITEDLALYAKLPGE